MSNSTKIAKGTGGSVKTDPNIAPVSNNRILYEAVVIDFFSNPIEDLEKTPPNDSVIYRESLLKGNNKVTNTGQISKMPRGSVTALVTSDASAWGGGKPEIFYPLFPHLTLPVKPGEKIWVIYESDRGATSRGYWIARISSDIDVDDPNYTHKDREFLYKRVPAESGPLAAATGTSDFDDEIVYGFLAGSTGNSSESTMPGDDPYNTIVAGSLSYLEQFTGEPVPRFSPRVGDLVLEGSNNTLICLGQDRPSLTSAVDLSGLTGIGTIDMVAGRGQTDVTNILATVPISKRGEDLLDYEEGNKFPEFNDAGVSNVGEGNPDFTNDLSRVYVSMNTNGDSNFGLSFTDLSAQPVAGAPYVIAKSTEIRLVSREGGSIRMMKEGTLDKAEICITSDGKIVIEGVDSGGRSSQQAIRGEELVLAVEALAGVVTPGMNALMGNFGAPVVDAGGIGEAFATFATAVRTALSEKVYIK